MPPIPSLLTNEGLEKLKNEYNDLKNKKLKKAVERLATARDQGDLTENSEYTAARDALSFIEERIYQLEKILKNVKTISGKKNSKVVEVGSKVTLAMNNKKITFIIVSELESDPIARKISPQSPIGMALMAKKKGDKVIVNVPDGKMEYKILAIE